MQHFPLTSGSGQLILAPQPEAVVFLFVLVLIYMRRKGHVWTANSSSLHGGRGRRTGAVDGWMNYFNEERLH